MTEEEFLHLWVEESTPIADTYYPKGSDRRGEYLRDQGLLHARVLAALMERGLIES